MYILKFFAVYHTRRSAVRIVMIDATKIKIFLSSISSISLVKVVRTVHLENVLHFFEHFSGTKDKLTHKHFHSLFCKHYLCLQSLHHSAHLKIIRVPYLPCLCLFLGVEDVILEQFDERAFIKSDMNHLLFFY